MDDNWGNAWWLMVTYCLSGFLWLGGFTVIVPNMLIYTVFEAVDGMEAFWMMMVGDAKGQYLSFENFLYFNVRRTVI